MKALVYTDTLELQYRDEPKPVPGAEESLIKIEAVGICGSDMHAYHGRDARRVPPLILGHEAVGVVAKGSQQRFATAWLPGTRLIREGAFIVRRQGWVRRHSSIIQLCITSPCMVAEVSTTRAARASSATASCLITKPEAWVSRSSFKAQACS